jgi:hypothetical protein
MWLENDFMIHKKLEALHWPDPLILGEPYDKREDVLSLNSHLVDILRLLAALEGEKPNIEELLVLLQSSLTGTTTRFHLSFTL